MPYRRRSIPLRIAFAVWILGSMVVGASGGELSGRILDSDDGPVAGAEVTVRGGLVERRTTSDAEGRYRVPFLEQASYRVEIAADGFGSLAVTEVSIVSGRTLPLDARLVAGSSDRHEPFASADGVENIGSGRAIVVEQVEGSVPVARDITGLFDLAPGVSDGSHPDLAEVNPSIAGASGLDNVYYVEGVEVTSGGYGALGTYALAYGSLGLGLTDSLLAGVDVRTGGFDAADGPGAGGVVRGTLRSGTASFTFDLGLWYTPDSLEGDHAKRLDAPNVANLTQTTRQEAAISASGPLLRDRLFGFAAYNPVTVEESFELTSGDANLLYDLDGDGMASDTFPVGRPIVGGLVPGEVTRERTVDNYAARLTWFATPDHKLDLVAFGDPSDGGRTAQLPTQYLRELAGRSSTRALGLDWGGEHLSLAWQGIWGPGFSSEARLSRRTADFAEDGPATASYAVFGLNQGRSVGGAGFYTEQTDETTAWSFRNTHLLGPVELSYGWQQQTTDWVEERRLSGPPFTVWLPNLVDDALGQAGFVSSCTDASFDAAGAPVDPDCYTGVRSTTGASVDLNSFGFSDRYTVTRSALSDLGATTSREERSAYAQAVWSPVPRLELRGGLRWTELELEGGGSGTVPFGFTGSFELTGLTTTTIEAGRYTFDGELAPRLGLTWDVGAGQRHLVYANWGRYLQRIPSGLVQDAFSRVVSVGGSEYSDSRLTQPILNSTCSFDVDGDGLFETTGPCHSPGFVTGLVGSGVLVLDGTQDRPGSTLSAVLGSFAPLAGSGETRLPYVDEWLLGYVWRVGDFTTLEARYVHRDLGRVVESMQFASAEQVRNLFSGASGGDPFAFSDPFPGHGAAVYGGLFVGNPGDGVDSRMFPAPERDYDAAELVFTRHFRDGWSASANYRVSRLEGNYEGWFRTDTNCPCAGLGALFDFPAASAVDRDGDGNFETFLTSGLMAGQYRNGPLNTERRHTFNGLFAKQFPFGLNLGVRLRYLTGQPREPLLVHPAYNAAGQIPGANPLYWYRVGVDTDLATDTDLNGDPTDDSDGFGFATLSDPTAGADLLGDQSTDFDGDGSNDRITELASRIHLFGYDVVPRDFSGTTPSTTSLDLHGSWDFRLRDRRSVLTVALDIFNLLDDTEPLGYDDNVEVRTGAANPDYRKPDDYQRPRQVRVGARFTW